MSDGKIQAEHVVLKLSTNYFVGREMFMVLLKGIKKTYNKGRKNAFEALRGIDLTINEKEMIAIVGKSGAGKSTLLHIIASIDDYDEGEYIYEGELVKKMNDHQSAVFRNKNVGLIMQDYALVEDYTVLENVMLPLNFDKTIKRKKGDRRKLAMEILNEVDMSDFCNNKCNELSGGQKQRVAIARAIVNGPGLIIADEPTGALDSANAGQIMKLLCKLKKKGRTVLIVTHDMNVAEYADRVLTMEDGVII